MTDVALRNMGTQSEAMYAKVGRPPICARNAAAAGTFYTIRSERMLMEQPDYNLLFRWFCGIQS
jgi:hypothetical protein